MYWQSVLRATPPLARLLLLLLLPLQAGGASGSPHSIFRTTYTAVSEPGPGLPQFTAAAFVDDLPIARYDSNTRTLLIQASWLLKMLEEHPEHWSTYIQIVQQHEADFRAGLGAVQAAHNQGAGLHTWQMMAGCEVGQDRPRGRYLRFGYNGRDFLSLDVETLNWTAADATAQLMQRSWEANPGVTQRFRAYVEETCAEWSQARQDHDQEGLGRREPPEVTVTRRAGQDDTETLTCRAHGFYPREIDMAWTRDGEVWLQDTFRGVLAPNSDETFHAWLSVRLDPWDRVRFLCRVEHDALQTLVELAWKDPVSSLGRLIWPTTGVLVVLPAVVLAALSLKTLRGAYGPASQKIQDDYRATKQHLQDSYEAARERLQRSYEEAKGKLSDGCSAALGFADKLKEALRAAFEMLDNGCLTATEEFGGDCTAAKHKLKEDLRAAFGKLGFSYRATKRRLDSDCQAAKRRLDDDCQAARRRLDDDCQAARKRLHDDYQTARGRLDSNCRAAKSGIPEATPSV